MLRLIGLIVIILSSVSINAQTYNSAPVDGVWWNPQESGRGWTIETQNDTTVILHFAFASDGRSTFFTTAGIWNGVTRTLTSSLNGFTAGQCIGCPYVPPTSSDLGQIRFVFTSTTRGTAIYPNGTTIPIEKFDFVYGDPRAYLKGQWASVWVSLTGSDFANFINFTTDCATCTTPNTVEGRLMFNSGSGRPVLGAPVSGAGIYLVIVDSTASFYDYYYIIPDTNRWTGVACTALKTSPAPSITTCLGLLYASRSKTRAAVSSSVPVENKKLMIDEAPRFNELSAGTKLNEKTPAEFDSVNAASVNALLNDFRALSESGHWETSAD